MAETYVAFDKKIVSFNGLFSINDLYKLMDKWFKDNSYSKDEKVAREKVEENGRYIYLLEQPYKKISDYIKIMIWIEIEMKNIIDVEVSIGNEKKLMNRGEVSLAFMGFVVTDYEAKWEAKPTTFVMRTIFDRFIFKTMLSKAEDTVKKDISQLMKEIKAFLNINNIK
ncbi:MAG: hypothetical protein GWP09_00080 [Nitrospiraceae bacterium]|nr:hypothetical protein [Nitrospiraceae bacterium]